MVYYDPFSLVPGLICFSLFFWHNLEFVSKGQLISELNFGVFKSPKKPTKF